MQLYLSWFCQRGYNWAYFLRAARVSRYLSSLSELSMNNYQGLKLHILICGCLFTVLEKHHTWTGKSWTEVWATNLFNYWESVLFRLVSGCLCMCGVRGCCCHSKFLSFVGLPLVSWEFAFRWAYLSTHKDQAFPSSCLWSWLPVYLQPVSQHQGCFYWQTHCYGLCFFLPGTQYHLIFFFFHRATKEAAKDHWSVHEYVLPLKVKALSRVSLCFHLTSETCLVCKVHRVW